MNKNHRKITILIAFFNDQKFILNAIKSVLKQSYTNWELILLDDGSTENTDLLKSFLQRKKNKKILYKRFSMNMGKAKVLNRGLEMATGEFVLELDADDWLHPKAVENFVAHIQLESKKVAMVYSDYFVIRKSSGRLNRKLIKARPFLNRIDWIKDLFVPIPRFYRKQALLDIGGWVTDYPSEGRLYEDLATILRLLKNYKMSYMPSTTLFVYKRPDSVTSTNSRSFFPIYNFLLARALKEWNEDYVVDHRDSLSINSTTVKSKKNLKQVEDYPLVTVIIPFQNNAHTILYTLQSIYTQNYPKLELFFINNHSSDETYAIIKEFIREQRSSHFTTQVIEKQAIPQGFNIVMGLANGRYVMTINSNEMVHPELIEQMVNRFEFYKEEKRIIGVFSDQKWFHLYPKWGFIKSCKNNVVATVKDVFEENFYPGPILYSIEDIKKIEGWPTAILGEGKYGGERYMMSQLMNLGSFVSIPRVLSIHLQGEMEEQKKENYWQVNKVLKQKALKIN